MRHLSQRGICGLITPHMCGLITSSHHTPLPPISPCLYHATCGNLHAHAMHKLLKGVWVGCRCGSLLSLPSPVGGFWLLSLPPCWSLLSSRPCASLLSLPPHRAETLAPLAACRACRAWLQCDRRLFGLVSRLGPRLFRRYTLVLPHELLATQGRRLVGSSSDLSEEPQ